jgi:hypothetical protein
METCRVSLYEFRVPYQKKLMSFSFSYHITAVLMLSLQNCGLQGICSALEKDDNP